MERSEEIVHWNVCKYKDRCKARADEPLLSGCTSGHPVEFINPKADRVKCPIREILFRGKQLVNGEWVEGYYAEF